MLTDRLEFKTGIKGGARFYTMAAEWQTRVIVENVYTAGRHVRADVHYQLATGIDLIKFEQVVSRKKCHILSDRLQKYRNRTHMDLHHRKMFQRSRKKTFENQKAAR